MEMEKEIEELEAQIKNLKEAYRKEKKIKYESSEPKHLHTTVRDMDSFN